MKKFLIVAGFISVAAAFTACADKRSPGRAYMPDMTYSRAYETYSETETRLRNSSVVNEGGPVPFYNSRPVKGTIARGDAGNYTQPNDLNGYTNSVNVKSPLDPATINLKEAERLYLVNCGICHGTKLDGNGPLYNDGNGPYTAKPATLVGDPVQEAMPEGRIFHVVTYGKGAMGSYASQLTTKQRWMVVAYVKGKQTKGKPAGAATDSTAAPAGARPDSTATAMAK